MEFLKLKSVNAKNFRNVADEIINFHDGINCIFGDNGNGKTNLLEVVYYLCQKKSFRKNTSFQQIISVDSGKPEILLSSVFMGENNLLRSISGKVNSKDSHWYVDNKSVKSKPKIPVVFINPFDSFSFHTIPAFRRSWVDQNLSQISKDYKQALSKYNQTLKQRNFLLSKKPNSFREQVIALDEQMVIYSKIILDFRLEFINDLKKYCSETFKIIFDEQHKLELKIDSKFINATQGEIASYFSNNLERDVLNGQTSYGIHRDDYVFLFDGFNSFEFCSLGQQKMSYLSLIFAYIELFRYKFNSYPIVLIDDVSGELDSRRWRNLIHYLEAKKFQVMITTANENFKNELEKIDNSKKIYIEDGFLKIN
jgi:DNA replication and repair protein RecF